LNFFFSVTLVQVDIMKGWGLLLTLAAVKKKKREREEKEERENRKEEREEGERAVVPEQAERQSSETVVQPRD
jgi:membrane protein implicated in regulation of membrane protease activity